MAKFEWNQTFLNMEGECIYSGQPTIYIRFSRCNFKCAGFNNPANNVTNDGYAQLAYDPEDKGKLTDMEPIDIGCDTQYAVNPRFAHMWKRGDESELADEVMNLLHGNSWLHPRTKFPIMLSITGGEPTLRHKTIPTLLNTPQFRELQHVLIETNCAVPLPDKFIEELNDWTNRGPNRLVTWSNSPKLSSSGESWDDAIKPEVANQQNRVIKSDQYFKFVCPPNQKSFDEVHKAMKQYWDADVIKRHNVHVMPECCTEDQQSNIAMQVADMCIENGLIYCHRIHNTVYANAIDK